MERICTHCQALVDANFPGDWCPGCGGALAARIPLQETPAPRSAQEIDHRGIQLPRRHALGGIITPQ